MEADAIVAEAFEQFRCNRTRDRVVQSLVDARPYPSMARGYFRCLRHLPRAEIADAELLKQAFVMMELEAVVAIARLGSFRAAAIDLDVSPTAIGNAVSSLENRLGVRLFNRTTRNVALTSAGREYVQAIAPALSDIRNAARAVADHSRKPTGTLRFSCSLGRGRQRLKPFVFEYLRRYDRMKVEIVTQGRLIDIIPDGFDAVARLDETGPL